MMLPRPGTEGDGALRRGPRNIVPKAAEEETNQRHMNIYEETQKQEKDGKRSPWGRMREKRME